MRKGRDIMGQYPIGIAGLLLIIDLFTGCQSQLCGGGDLYGDICIVYVNSQTLPWQDARDYCLNRYQGDLISIEDATRQGEIKALMQKHSAALVWTGGSESIKTHWTWSTENRVAQQQGCFKEDSSSPEFIFTPDPRIENVTSLLCLPVCVFHGYQYAALQDGTECLCGHSFGKYGPSADCNKECAGNPEEICGGKLLNSIHYYGGGRDPVVVKSGCALNYVYKKEGQMSKYAGWAPGQPNNFDEKHFCSCLSRSEDIGLLDEPCDSKYLYICDVPASSCDPIVPDSEGTYQLMLINRCYYMSTIERTWENSRQQCRERGGDLAQVTAPFLQEELIRLTSGSLNQRLWIGLAKIEFHWPTGPMSYTNFASEYPVGSPDSCVQISAGGDYQWADNSCTLARNFYCQYDITKVSTTTSAPTTTTTPAPTPAPTTTASTTPTTNTTFRSPPTTTTASTSTTSASPTTTPTDPSTVPTTVTPTTTASSGGGGGGGGDAQTPQAAQATNESSNRVVIIVFLVIIIILIILTIIGIIVVVVLRRKNEKRRAVQPNHFIPYTSQTDVKEYMSAPAFDIHPPPEKHVRFTKTSHGTQTSEHSATNNYTKHMLLQRDGTVSDRDSGIGDVPVMTITREEKARTKPPHTPIIYHETDEKVPKRKHGRYAHNKIITPSARTLDSNPGLENHRPSSKLHANPAMYDSDSNMRGSRRRSNRVNHSDSEMIDDDIRYRGRTVDIVSDSDDGRQSRLYRVDRHPEPELDDVADTREKQARRLDRKPKERKREKTFTSDTEDTERNVHRGPSHRSSSKRVEDHKHPELDEVADARRKRAGRLDKPKDRRNQKSHISDTEDTERNLHRGSSQGSSNKRHEDDRQSQPELDEVADARRRQLAGRLDTKLKERKRQQTHTSDTEDTERNVHGGPSHGSSSTKPGERRHDKPSKHHDGVEHRSASKQKQHSSDEESGRNHREPVQISDQESRRASTTDDSESERRRVALQMKVFLETDDEENPAIHQHGGSSKGKKLKVCPECRQKVRMLWKHLVSKHGMSPGSAQLQDAMEQSKTMEKKTRID